MIRTMIQKTYRFVFGLSLDSVTKTFNKAISRLERIEAQLGAEVEEHNRAIDSHFVSKTAKLKDATHAGKVRARLENLIAE